MTILRPGETIGATRGAGGFSDAAMGAERAIARRIAVSMARADGAMHRTRGTARSAVDAMADTGQVVRPIALPGERIEQAVRRTAPAMGAARELARSAVVAMGASVASAGAPGPSMRGLAPALRRIVPPLLRTHLLDRPLAC